MRAPVTLLSLALLGGCLCAADEAPKAREASQAKKPVKLNAAQKMAAALAGILKDYVAQVDQKIAAEKQAYAAAAKLYAAAQDQTVFLALTTDRMFDAESRAAWLADGTLTVNRLLFDEIPAYGKRDFDHTREVFERRFDSYRSYLANLQDLSIERAKADALLKALEDLSAKPSLGELVASLKTYGEATAKQMKYSDCALTVARVSLYRGQQARLEERLKEAKSDEAKRDLNGELKAVKDRIGSFQEQLTKLRDAGVYDDQKKSCKSPA